MNSFELNRREALIAAGMGAMSLGMPGMVMGTDKRDGDGKAVRAEKSCIFVLLCGGPSHVDTWDMKPNAPTTIRGPYQPIATRVPGMRINEMHTRLAKLTDQFTLINSMTHPGAISNHFDAMHNLLSGQSEKRVSSRAWPNEKSLSRIVSWPSTSRVHEQLCVQRLAHQVRRTDRSSALPTSALAAISVRRMPPCLRGLSDQPSGNGPASSPAADLRPEYDLKNGLNTVKSSARRSRNRPSWIEGQAV